MELSQKLSSIGDYLLLQTLGCGRNSKVKLGFHKPTGTYVAIKLAKKQKNESNERTLRNEFFFLKEIKHPNLINLIDFSLGAEYRKKNGVIQKSMYTVLELAQGGPLFDYLAFTGKFSEDTARTFFNQLISALGFLHSKGVCHRDLKPENLLLTENFSLKIADFGFSKLFDKNLTTLLGTQNYMAPELHLKMAYSGNLVDLFAAGTILFIMVLAHPPFGKADPRDPLYKLICTNKHECFWNYHEKKSAVSKELKNLLNSMLAFDPTQRLSIGEIMAHKWMQGPKKNDDEVVKEFVERKNKIENRKKFAKERARDLKEINPQNTKFYLSPLSTKQFRSDERGSLILKLKYLGVEKREFCDIKELSNQFCYFCLTGDLLSIFIAIVEISFKEFNDVEISQNKYKLKCVDINADADTSISLNIKLFKIDENAYYLGFFRKKGIVCDVYDKIQAFESYFQE